MTPVVKTNGHGNGNGALGISSPPAKKRPAPPPFATADGRVIFQTAEGVTVVGTPVQFNRHNVVWELYNPSLALRLSETLDQFKIIFQGRTIYAGRAVVNNLVDAGAKTVCDATLDEANWAGLDLRLCVEFRLPPKAPEGWRIP